MWPQTADYSMTSPSSAYNSSAGSISANSSAFFGSGFGGDDLKMNEFQHQLAMSALAGGGFPLMPNYSTAVAMADSTTQNQYGQSAPLRAKKKPQPVPENQKDKQYHDRRKKNNISAQKSREARRIRERRHAELVDQLTKEVSTLHQVNAHLQCELQRRQAQIYALQQQQQQNGASEAENATSAGGVAVPRMPFAAMGSYVA